VVVSVQFFAFILVFSHTGDVINSHLDSTNEVKTLDADFSHDKEGASTKQNLISYLNLI